MGRSDYIVQAGIGFDLDRSSAKKSVGIFETIANTLNVVAAKKAKEGFAATEKEYDTSMKNAAKINQKADKDLIAGVKSSAKATQQALQKAAPKPLTEAAKAKMDPAAVKTYEKAFKASMGGMSSSYSKFAKEAAKLGIKVRKSQKGWGSGQSVADFAKKDVETRTRLVKLTERMIKDEKDKLKETKKGTKAYTRQLAEIEALTKQHKSQKNLNDDIIQQEKKADKIKRKAASAERKAEKKKGMAQRKILANLKNLQYHTKRLGQIAQASAGRIGSGLKNAFVVGTAAAAVFFAKMQPLAATVQEFEKTIINANSVFNVTKKELHEVSDSMVQFTLKYGVSAQDTATGLYQLASAGLSAAESQEVLQHTMKLAMATQGDHNALAKLTVQTIMGFGMEMSDTSMLVDKFAHSIQKSLIEWEDLASSVKFAMPFFVATGQSIDELLGGLEVLTNRALEAGIAGRGLRQALAQFAKHAGDNESAMRKLGIEIMDTEGNMRALHEIAQDASAAFGDVTDLEALTIMLEDMNVRGATAFALLVQNADEFEQAVVNISDSAGEATLMADIQQESLANQIQLVKNALLAPFLFADEVGAANDTLNEFTWRIKEIVKEFTEFFIVTKNGEQALTEHSDQIKQFVLDVLEEAVFIIGRLKDIFLEQEAGLTTFTDLLYLATAPLKIMLDILDYLGPTALKWLVYLKAINMILPISNILYGIGTYMKMKYMMTSVMTAAAEKTEGVVKLELAAAQKIENVMKEEGLLVNIAYAMGLGAVVDGQVAVAVSGMAMMVGFAAFAGLMAGAVMTTGRMSDVFLALAGAVAIAGMAMLMLKTMTYFPNPLVAVGVFAALSVGVLATMWAARNKLQGEFAKRQAQSFMDYSSLGGGAGIPTERSYDSGGTFLGGARMYDMGGPTTEHGMAVLQKGETIIPKTQNMLGSGRGITLNIHGDVYDSDNFAEKISEVLPEALRKTNDIGGI